MKNFEKKRKTGSRKKFDGNKEYILYPLKAIRAHCVECSGSSEQEVKHCTIESCPLYPYRFGKSVRTARESAPYSPSDGIRTLCPEQ